MENKIVMRLSAGIGALACILLAGVTAAHAGEQGEYFLPAGTNASENAVKRIALKSDGKAIVDMMGTTVAATYAVDGDKVIITNQQGQVGVFTQDGHGCLDGEAIIGGHEKLCKK
jgi:hypothetical protein